jgi:hypothetical protein
MPYKVWIPGETLKANDLNQVVNQLVNTTASYTFTGVHTHDANVVFNQHATFNDNINVSDNAYITGNVNASGNVADNIGNVRGVYSSGPVINGYNIQIQDIGKFVYATGDVNLPLGILNPGDNVTIYNSTAGSINVTHSPGTFMYLAGLGISSDGVLDSKGLCTILCVDTNIMVIASTTTTQATNAGGGSGGSAAITYDSVINALQYIPYNQTNPFLFPNTTNSFGLSQTGLFNTLGYTPYNASNPAGYITAADVPAASGRLIRKPFYVSAGTTTYTTPAGCTLIQVKMLGGGGGGGAAGSNGGTGGGGGGGAYIEAFITATPNTSYSIGVGTAGIGASGQSGLSGSSGGDSFIVVGGTRYSAGGGDGGVGFNSGAAGGRGGLGSNGDLNIPGYSGNGGGGDGGMCAYFSPGSSTISPSNGAGLGGGGSATFKGCGGGGGVGNGGNGSGPGGNGVAGLIQIFEYT